MASYVWDLALNAAWTAVKTAITSSVSKAAKDYAAKFDFETMKGYATEKFNEILTGEEKCNYCIAENKNRKNQVHVCLPRILEINSEIIGTKQGLIKWDIKESYYYPIEQEMDYPLHITFFLNYYLITINTKILPVFFYKCENESDLAIRTQKLMQMVEFAENTQFKYSLPTYTYGQHLVDNTNKEQGSCYACLYIGWVPKNYINLSRAYNQQNAEYNFCFFDNVPYLYNNLKRVDSKIINTIKKENKSKRLKQYIETPQSKMIKELLSKTGNFNPEQIEYYAAFFDPLYLEHNMDLVFYNVKLLSFFFSIFDTLKNFYFDNRMPHKTMFGTCTYITKSKETFNIEDFFIKNCRKYNLKVKVQSKGDYLIPRYKFKFFGIENTSNENFNIDINKKLPNTANTLKISSAFLKYELGLESSNEIQKIPYFFEDILCDRVISRLNQVILDVDTSYENLFNDILKIYATKIHEYYTIYYQLYNII